MAKRVWGLGKAQQEKQRREGFLSLGEIASTLSEKWSCPKSTVYTALLQAARRNKFRHRRLVYGASVRYFARYETVEKWLAFALQDVDYPVQSEQAE